MPAPTTGNAPICSELSAHAGDAAFDSGPVLLACIAAAPEHGAVNLPVGVYYLHNPITITKAVALQTAGTSESAATVCDPRNHACATLKASPTATTLQPDDPTMFLLTIRAEGGSLNHIVLDMSSRVQGLLLDGKDWHIMRNGFTGARHTSYFNSPNATGTVIVQNFAVNNGVRAGHAFSDGFTIKDGKNLVVEDNVFWDNTDVPLIFGGCRACSVRRNTITQSGDANRGSFAALAIYTWEDSSGDYTGTTFSGNHIDCNAQCGFGEYIGSYSWNGGPPITGGTIDGETIVNAQIGIYIDHAVGTTVTDNNGITAPTGGQWTSSCGKTYGPTVLAMAVDPAPNQIIQIGIGATAPNLFNNHKKIIDLRKCIPNFGGM